MLKDDDTIAEIFLTNGTQVNLKMNTIHRHRYGTGYEPFKSFQARVGREVKRIYNELRTKSEFRMEMPELKVQGRVGLTKP